MAAGAAPRESHPSGGLPEPYSLPVTPGRLRRLHARTMTIREYHYALCVSLPASCHACFTVGMLVARSFQSFLFLRMNKRSWRIPRPALRREDVSVCRILHRNYPPGFLCQGTIRGTAWKEGNTQRPALNQFRSKFRIEIISFVSSRLRMSSSTKE